MAPVKEKAEHLDEIVFKDRNKSYGAYFLRKIYKKHVTIATIISVSVLLVGVTVPLIAGYLNKKRIVIDDKNVAVEMTQMNKPPEDAPPPPPPPPPEELLAKAEFKAPIVTTDSVEETTVFIMEDLNLQSTNTTVDTTDFVVHEENKVIQEPVEEPFLVVEEMPSFPGDEGAMSRFLKENITYPEVERDNGVMGLVVVSFTVEKDGSISNVNILKSMTPNLDAEAIRVVKSMPKWNPGRQSGRNVRVTINVPIRFTLN